MAKVIARFEKDFSPEASDRLLPFVDSYDLDRLRGAEVTLALANWHNANIAEQRASGVEGPLKDNGNLLVELDDGTLAIASFGYYISNRIEGGKE